MKKILLFSTLNPYPFWAGSENFWFDFVADERFSAQFNFHLVLADSPVTRKKVSILTGAKTSFYKHFNIDFVRRNAYRLADKICKKEHRTLPWFNEIKNDKYDIVWFNVAALSDLQDLVYPVQICKRLNIPYWLVLQHGYEDFFLTSEREIETVREIAASAERFVFISKRNRLSLERAIGEKLNNAFHSINALPKKRIEEAKIIAEKYAPRSEGAARFFNLGRFSPKDKAQHLLLEALGANNNWKSRDWRLSFVGVSAFGAFYLKKLIDFYAINREKIEIVPHTEDVFAEIAKNDILLMPSLAEGTPFSMVESMACGKPALGTPVGGIPELVIENETGWLTRTVDVVDISEGLEQAWRERERWEEFGLNAQQRIEANYNGEKSFAELARLLAADANL